MSTTRPTGEQAVTRAWSRALDFALRDVSPTAERLDAGAFGFAVQVFRDVLRGADLCDDFARLLEERAGLSNGVFDELLRAYEAVDCCIAGGERVLDEEEAKALLGGYPPEEQAGRPAPF